MINKKRILKHAATDKSFPSIYPAKTAIPEWYKNTPRFIDNKKPTRFPINSTFKICSVFGESFTSGYMIPLAVDIAVEQTDEGAIISWASNKEVFVILRDPKSNESLPIPSGYHNQHFVWETKHMVDIPDGYSLLITHPLNRHDLPFITSSGIVDGKFVMYNGNIPVFFNKTFEGIIPSGTPIAQIIPFKTESWSSMLDNTILEEGKINMDKSSYSAYGWYKKNIWKKKQYE